MENIMDNFLSIKVAVQRYSASCDGKIKTPFDKLFIKAVLAGMMIAMGAAGSSVACHAIGNVGLARLVAGVVFPVGLMMVILTGAELFTGDCLMIVATVEKKNTMAQMIKELFFIYIGNFVAQPFWHLVFISVDSLVILPICLVLIRSRWLSARQAFPLVQLWYPVFCVISWYV